MSDVIQAIKEDSKVALQTLAEQAGAPLKEVEALHRALLEAATSDVGMPSLIVAGMLFGMAQSFIDRVEHIELRRSALIACIQNCQDQLEVLYKKHGPATK